MSQNHVNVLICTPGRSMEAEYVKSLVGTVGHLNASGITYLYLNEYSSQVNAAREATAMGSRFLRAFDKQPLSGQVTYDKMIWIDSDISWTVEQFVKMYESPYEIVSGVYYNHEGVPMFSTDENEIYYDHGTLRGKEYPFEIFAAGFGFLAVKSGVFEAMPRPWFDTVFQRIESDQGEEMFIPWGEDYSWCKKAKEVGFKIYLDPSVRVGHHKKVML